MRIRITRKPPVEDRHAINVGNVYEIVDLDVKKSPAWFYITSETTGERVGISARSFETIPDPETTPAAIKRPRRSSKSRKGGSNGKA